MGKTDKRFEDLAEKWLNGKITREEKEEFAQWYNTIPDEDMHVPPGVALNKAELRNRLLNKIKPVRKSAIWLPALAAAVVVVGLVGLLVLWSANGKIKPVGTAAARKSHIMPGRSDVVLTLSNGAQVALETMPVGKIMKQAGATLLKAGGNVLSYSHSASPLSATSGYNTVSVGKGGIYQLQLADGTKVWLNSTSSLRFPVSFSGNSREVYLEGEAYFDVARDERHPFVVHSEKINVHVLGTAFDMMSYRGDDAVRTTLESGKIKLLAGSTNLVVLPGQQASLAMGDSLFTVTKPDLDEVLSWKDGRFHFTNANIKAVMRQLERWYDVTVQYQGDVSALNLTGSLSRKENVEELLKVFERTSGAHISINDNVIIVSPQ